MSFESSAVVAGSSSINVLICDDHSVVRSGVKTALSANPAINVTGEAQCCDETLRLVEELQPRVVILDLKLPGRNGLEVLHALKNSQASTSVLVFTMFDDEATILKAFASGARGFILKSSPAGELLKATETLAEGAIYIPAAFSHLRSDIEDLVSGSGKKAEQHFDPLASLSKREREIFFMLVDGQPNRNVAKNLFISPRTVETHRARIIKKLNVDSSAGLIRYAIRHNLISL